VIERPRIASAANDLLVGEDGTRYIDLFTAHGTTWLGHAHPAVTQGIREQLEKVWITGGLPTATLDRARTALEAWFPATHRLVALYSTGMEAMEFALRVARVATGRAGAVGFANSMHGKSLVTAQLGWAQDPDVAATHVHRLPFLDSGSEEAILQRLGVVLETRTIGAVCIEPIQGCGAGRMASPAFHAAVARLCRVHGVLLVFDELLTGFHRTGPAFMHRALGVEPDLVVVGKALANGFPASAVVADRAVAITPPMLPGSTYSGNALACAAIAATLDVLAKLDVEGRVERIGAAVDAALAPVRDAGIVVRGRGALWFIECASDGVAEQAVIASYRAGVCVGYAGRQIRLLPAATIEPRHLERGACAVAKAAIDAHRDAAAPIGGSR
jgi:acetylornithine/succinyldiaminopimelate/putrescine aminotransferase